MKNADPGPCSVGDCDKPRERHSRQRVKRIVEGEPTFVMVDFYRSTCAAHRKRKNRQLVVSGPVRERARTPLDGLYRAALELKDELDTLTNEEFARSKERFRESLRRYLVKYIPDLLRRQQFSPGARGEVDRFAIKYEKSRS